MGWRSKSQDEESWSENDFDFIDGIVGLTQAAIRDAETNGTNPVDELEKFEDRIPDSVFVASGMLLENLKYSRN